MRLVKLILFKVLILSSLVSHGQRSAFGYKPADFSKGRLLVSENNRYLIYEDGTPFFYLGCTAWELFHRVTREEAEKYLENRRQKGFTVIQAVILAELDGLKTPNPYGELPLLDENPLTPNEKYFEHVDWIIRRAEEKGMFIGLLPTWGDNVNGIGFRGEFHPILQPDSAYCYGQWLGNRYRDYPNIIWINGGDRPGGGDNFEKWDALGRGIKSVDKNHLMTYHPNSPRTSSEWFHSKDWLDFNMAQTGHRYRSYHIFKEVLAPDYHKIPVKPFMNGEPCYEDHPVLWKPEVYGWFDELDVRQAAYWSVFSGAFGHTYGAHPIWQMKSPERNPVGLCRNNWYDVLDLPGAQQMSFLRKLMESRPMLSRVPDQSLILNQNMSDNEYIVASRGDGYAFIYTAYGLSPIVNLDKLEAEKVIGWWFNPRSGESFKIGEFAGKGILEFAPEGNRIDWVLVLDDLSKNFPPPGQQHTIISLKPGEKIWAGVIKEGHQMPYPDSHQFDFYANNLANQLQPLLLSNKGLWVWSEQPYKFEIANNELIISRKHGEVTYGREGNSLAEAHHYATRTFFPPSGKMPDPMLFSAPQYNTWIELTYNQNQKDILNYAHSIIDNGLPPGVLMIDATWQLDYGVWEFHPGRFPEPKAMMDELHEMGFKVMLWICPFVSADQYQVVTEIMEGKGLLLNKSDENTTWENASEPAIIKWWDGHSALLDFSNPYAVDWFNTQLDRLVREYKVDGFKFDAGDMNFYPSYALGKEDVSPNRHCELFAQFGLRFPLNEYRACWKMAGQPLAQRLHDKNHNWEDLGKLIPHMITESYSGYTFACPDMIGGGEFKSFLNRELYDQELVVRSAQCHALMPMMQFSVAPWRILDAAHFSAVKKAVDIRREFIPLIMELSEKSAVTGEPIISGMEYYFPNQDFEEIRDQFMLGGNILVAPMLEKGSKRAVILPKGKWQSDDGKKYIGGKTYTIDVPLNRIPYF
ncbi:MAG: DUF4038 domain-containing protein, partial [Bacteroidales bacterium]|nr:DUF4038 domain-containing protein [Bacteroidales bacterium]